MESFKKYSSLFVFPGLTAITGFISLIIVISKWNSTCDDYSNTVAHVWLLVYAICCIPGCILASLGVFGTMSLTGRQNPYKACTSFMFLVFLIATLIWNIAGYIMLFGYFKCFSNPMAVMMLIDIIYQTFCLVYSFIVGCIL